MTATFEKNKTYAIFETVANKKLIDDLANLEIETVIFPAIKVNLLESPETESVLNNLANFDWLVFPDVYSVDFFIESLRKLNFDLFELDNLRVCAFSESVSDRLRFSQLHADVIPLSFKTLDVMKAIQDFVAIEDEFENLRFLYLKEKEAKADLIGELETLKAYVCEISIYSFESDRKSEIPKLKALLKGGAIDEFIFSTPEDVFSLANLLQTQDLAAMLFETKLTPSNAYTAQILKEFINPGNLDS